MKKNRKKNEIIEKNESKDIFESSKAHFLMIGLIIAVLCIQFYKIGFQGYAPQAHDTFQWRWGSQELIEYNQNPENKGRALWTDNMFSGMPSYLLSFPPKIPFFHQIPFLLNQFINWRLTYLIFGAIGMYFLLVYLKFSPLIALFAALAFAQSPHFIGLIEIGHNTKFRTIMYLPWILLAFDDLRQRRRLLSLGLFCIFLIDQLRINHFQISYYTLLMLFIYWLVYFIEAIKTKTVSNYNQFSLMFLAGLIIVVLGVANPYLSTYEYSYYTLRGGSAGGLSTDYATSWSFGIQETLSLFVPFFYGGISPYYWGPMPFTQTFHYMGIIVIYLAMMASIFYFRNTQVKALIVISIVALLISFGKHLPFLSNLLLNYLPLFNKFRVPAMILCLLQFAVPILAAYGLKLFVEKIKVKDPLFNRVFIFSLIATIGILVLFFRGNEFFSSLSFTNPERQEATRFSAEQFRYLRAERLDLLLKSGLQSFIILAGSLFLLLLMIKGWVKKNIVLVLLAGLVVLDLTLINDNHLNDNILVQESTILQDFQTRETDLFFLDDDDTFRIYPVEDFGNSRWSYYHQTIGGYHGAKLSRYSDIIDPPRRILNSTITAGVPINWNIINMLNVKYLIFNSHVDLVNPEIELIFLDSESRHVVYRNNEVLPRAWFVKNYEIITDVNRRFLRLSDPSFNPANTVLVEQQIPDFSFAVDSSIEMLERDIHHTIWSTSSEEDSFMVISEVHFPAGWKVYINGVETEIYPVNHFLRGVFIPAGDNLVEMRFKPKSYSVSIILSYIGIILALGFTLYGIVDYYISNYGKGMVYNVKV
ncbi:MAG: hypothetical protein FWG98_11685 [Candidatus Cloacimonetes bacterium]|nr:hypothetical protein [Candidatus Cloacimonadota bacterium]